MLSSTEIKKWKSLSDLILGWISVIGVFCGAGYTVVQYIDNLNNEKVRETLSFIERFNSSENMKSRNKIDVFLRKHKVDSIYTQHGEEFYKKYINKIINDEIISDIYNIFDFYDQLYVCSSSNLCNKDVSIKLFGKYAYSIYGTLNPIVQKEHDYNDKKFGEGMHYFSKEYYLIYDIKK